MLTPKPPKIKKKHLVAQTPIPDALYTTPVNPAPTPTPSPTQCWLATAPGMALSPAPAGYRHKRLCRTPGCLNPAHSDLLISRRQRSGPRPRIVLLNTHITRWSKEEKVAHWDDIPIEFAQLFWRMVNKTDQKPKKFAQKCNHKGCTNPAHWRGLVPLPLPSPLPLPEPELDLADEIEALSLIPLALPDIMTFILSYYVPQHFKDAIRQAPDLHKFLEDHTDWS